MVLWHNFINEELYLYVALVCALSVILLWSNCTPAIGKQLSVAKERSVLVTATKIRKGEKIQKGMIVEVSLLASKIPQDAVEIRQLVMGKRPSHDIPRNKIIQECDFLDLAGINIPFVCTAKEISAGTLIEKADLKLVSNMYYSNEPLLPPRPHTISAVVGKKAKSNIAKDHKIIDSDIIP